MRAGINIGAAEAQAEAGVEPVHMEDDSSENVGNIAEEMIRARILHTLTIFPKLSMSMLQIGIGTGFPPALWHPVLEDLIRDGKVSRTTVQATNPVTQRGQTYTIMALGDVGV